MAPRLIHVIYFPWDDHHRLKSDENDFDHTPINLLQKYAPDFEVKLWTFSKAREFCLANYPDVWHTVENCPHPTMMVDILRWLFVYHFGGIYWQVSTTPLVSMEKLLPSPNKTVRLFTEFEMTPEQCAAMASEPIRQGEPEEPTRVLNQVFSAEPQTLFIRSVLELILKRNRTLVPRSDYDILYIGANAALSTAYDLYGKNDPNVELLNRELSKQMLHWKYLGSWRKHATKTKAEWPIKTFVPNQMNTMRDRLASFYQKLRRHVYEDTFEQLDRSHSRSSLFPELMEFAKSQKLRTVFEAPSGYLDSSIIGFKYCGGHPSRNILKQLRAHNPEIRYRHTNMIHDCLPPVDLLICGHFLEWTPYRETFRVLNRILAAKPRFFALTSYCFLNDAWDTALGDFRPLAFHLPPFQFPPPFKTLPLTPPKGGRSDLCLMVWNTRDIVQSLQQ